MRILGELTDEHIQQLVDGDPGARERELVSLAQAFNHVLDELERRDLKRGLAQRFPNDIEAYMDGKDAFIKEIDRRAAAWLLWR